MSAAPRLLLAAPALALLAACAGTSLQDAPLDGVELSASSDRTLVVTGVHGGCDTVLEPEVTETATQVRIRVPLRVQSGDCTSIGLSLREQVVLEQPLGDRVVVDDARDEPLEVTGR